MSNMKSEGPEGLYPLTRDEVRILEPLLPVARRQIVPLYIFVCAIVFFLKNGTHWRSLDQRYEFTDKHGNTVKVPWMTLYRRYRRWQEKGVIDNAFHHFRDEVYPPGRERGGSASMDSSSHKLAPSVYGRDDDTIGRSVGGPNTKLHALTSNDAFPYWMGLGAGNETDISHAKKVVETIGISRFSYFLADRGYVSKPFRETIIGMGVEPVIPPKRNMKDPYPYDKEKYKERSIVENLFNRLKRHAHIATRYDRLSGMFLSFIQLACIVNYLTCTHRPMEGRWRKN